MPVPENDDFGLSIPDPNEGEGWDEFESKYDPDEEPEIKEEPEVEEEVGEKIEKAEAEAEKEVEEKEVPEAPEAKPPEVVIPPEVEEILRTVGGETELNVKGKWLKVSELPKQEIKNILQKGTRFYQEMEELSGREKAIMDQESLLAERARYIDSIGQQRAGLLPGGLARATTIPKELQVNDYDTDEVKSLKSALINMGSKVEAIEGASQAQTLSRGKQELMNEINSYSQEYPLAGLEEVVAVKVLYPNVPVEKIMQESHRNRSSQGHIDKIFKSCPDLERHYYEASVAKYLKVQKTLKVNPSKPIGSTVSNISSGKSKIPRDFDEAGDFARARFAEMQKQAGEEGLE